MKKNMRPNNTPKIVGFVVVAVVVFLLYPSGSPAGCPSTGTRYGIMMDAGSTGSRVHVFEFDYSASGAVTLKDELFVETKPGLSAFKDSPADGVASLKPLLDAAIKKVPAELARCTPIELKATAGLRLIGTEKSDAILRAVLDALRASPFLVRGDDAAIVMDGKDEGPYAWITVNFLLETVRSNAKSKTAAILDMGGASTQLVFQPDSSKTMTTVAQDQTYSVKLEGYHSSVYTHSHLGYGLKQANKKMYQAAPDAKSFPCFPKDATDTIDDVTVSNENGVQSFEKCLEIADQILKKNAKCEAHSCSFNGVAQPQLATTFSGPLYLMSYYYDRMQYFIDQDGKSTVGGLRKMAEGVCAGEKAPYAEYNKKTMCADLTYLYALLRTGYDVPESTPIYVKKKINGIETAWALGAMMVAMNPRS